MSNELLATAITVGGSIVTAIITGVTALVTKLIEAGKIAPDSAWKWVKLLGYPLAVVAVAFGGFLVFYILYDGTASRLSKTLPDLPDHTKRIYANVGLGFVLPQKWQVEDYAFRFGGGDMTLVSARDESGLMETQGVVIGISNIAEHHWPDPESEFRHVEDQLKVRCTPNGWSRETAAIASGRQAALFKCRRVKGNIQADERIYWYQLSPCVRLEIRSWSELTGQPRAKFDQELSQFLSYLRLDDIKIQSLINGKRTGCLATTS